MNFREAESYLLSLGNEVETMKLGLDNIRKLLAALGNPQNDYLKVQVAGTNGKGSVCAFLDSICLRAGIKTGVFTSPHLVSITERIRIDGVDIAEDDFARHATVVRGTAESLLAIGGLEYTPTFFEQITAIALLAFAEAKVELAILETGLGGRLDATTAANAEIAAITRIDLDHQEYLGDTLAEIAAEKAAISRPDSRVVVAQQEKAVERVIMGRCRELGLEAIWATKNISIIHDPEMLHYLFGTFTTESARYSNILPLEMPGEHQFQNAAVAIAVAETLRDFDFEISHEDIVSGLENAHHSGRLEYSGGGQFLFDGAHNIGGAKALAQFLAEFVEQPITMIFGAVRGKDVTEIGEILFPKAENVILTKLENSRAMTAQEIADALPKGVGATKLHMTSNVAEAMAKAESLVANDGLILVTGSLYLVGEVKRLLKSQI